MNYTEYCKFKKPEQEDIYNVDDFNDNADQFDAGQHDQDIRLLALEKSVSDILSALEALTGRVKRLEDALFNKVTSNPFSVTFETLDDVEVTGVWNRERNRMEC